jgi:N-acetylgalactosamine-6-sulfatase
LQEKTKYKQQDMYCSIIQTSENAWRSLLVSILFIPLLAYPQRPNSERPNIVFVFADDLGWGDLGCYGNPHIHTPSLDRMAQKGMRLTGFYVSSPVCSPSRTAIMTGQFPARHRIHTAIGANKVHNDGFHQDHYLSPDVVLLTRLLKEGGYRTGHFGKWHLGAIPSAPDPGHYGIDEYYVTNSSDSQLKVPRYKSTEVIIDKAIDFIERHKDERFYINVWTLVPHANLDPTDQQMAPYAEFGPQGPAALRGFSTPAQIYYAAVTDLDLQIGRLMDKLSDLGLEEETLVIFSSDNGPESIHIPNAAHSGIGSPGPFRGRKRSLYDGGVRVPCILQWTNRIPAGIIDDHSVVGGVDLLPTICSLAGVELPKGYAPDGENVSVLMDGGVFVRNKPLFWEWRFTQAGHVLNKSPGLALRDNRWKFLINPDGSRAELYDMESIGLGPEVNNVAEKYPDLVQHYSDILLNFDRSLPGGAGSPGAGKNTYSIK